MVDNRRIRWGGEFGPVRILGEPDRPVGERNAAQEARLTALVIKPM